MHWRDKRRATDLSSLKEQVRLWQDRALLSWSEDDIVEVTRYLNQTIYRFSPPTVRSSVVAELVLVPVLRDKRRRRAWLISRAKRHPL